MKTLTALVAGPLAALLYAATSLCASAAPAPILRTSFDCAQARVPVEKLICRDPQLKQMDIELTRLYRLALTDDHSEPPPDKVMIDQRFWTEARNQCGAEREPKPCAIRRYAERAHQLRQGSAIARTKDPDSLTDGPLTLRCAGVNGPIAATFFRTQPGVVYLKWENASTTLSQTVADPQSAYTGKDNQGNYSLWQNDTLFLFRKPATTELSCTVEPAS